MLAIGSPAGGAGVSVTVQPANAPRVQLPALTGEQAAALATALDDVSRRVVARLPLGGPRDALAAALRELRTGLPAAPAPELIRRVQRARIALDRLVRAPPRTPVDTALVRLLLEQVDRAADRAAPRAPPLHRRPLPP